eukprot:PhF_6_TR29313/c2_g2_i1/m.42990
MMQSCPICFEKVEDAHIEQHVQECFSQNVQQQCPVCFKMVNGDQNLFEWHVQQCSTSPLLVPCVSCLGEYEVRDIYSVNCPLSHKVCRDCIKRMIGIAVKDRALAACPCVTDGKKCNYTLTSPEIRGLLDGTAEDRAVFLKYQRIELNVALSDEGQYFMCPSCGHHVFESINFRRIPHPFKCDKCGTTSCTMLGCVPYHYGATSCEEARNLQAQWLHLTTQIGSLNLSAEYVQDQNNRFQQLQTLVLDEERKAEVCRHCPNCTRIIERMEGCSNMWCGQDYHYGNNQNGCGATFKWDQAARYVAVIPTPPRTDHIMEELRSTRNHGNEFPCKLCGKAEIVGPRFSCVCCPRR